MSRIKTRAQVFNLKQTCNQNTNSGHVSTAAILVFVKIVGCAPCLFTAQLTRSKDAVFFRFVRKSRGFRLGTWKTKRHVLGRLRQRHVRNIKRLVKWCEWEAPRSTQSNEWSDWDFKFFVAHDEVFADVFCFSFAVGQGCRLLGRSFLALRPLSFYVAIHEIHVTCMLFLYISVYLLSASLTSLLVHILTKHYSPKHDHWDLGLKAILPLPLVYFLVDSVLLNTYHDTNFQMEMSITTSLVEDIVLVIGVY